MTPLHHGDGIGIDHMVRLSLPELLEELFFFVGSPKEAIDQALKGVTQARGPRVWFVHAVAWEVSMGSSVP